MTATTSLHPVATEELGGETVVRYEGEVDVASATETTDDADLLSTLRELSSEGVPTLTYEIVVDRDNLLRAFDMSLPIGPGAAAAATYSDWGQPVTIEAPDPTVVVGWQEALGG